MTRQTKFNSFLKPGLLRILKVGAVLPRWFLVRLELEVESKPSSIVWYLENFVGGDCIPINAKVCPYVTLANIHIKEIDAELETIVTYIGTKRIDTDLNDPMILKTYYFINPANGY